jgi:Tfp pilus assembly protein PilF
MACGQADLAIADFGRAIALPPDHPRAFRNRANVHLKKGRVREVYADFERVGIHS